MKLKLVIALVFLYPALMFCQANYIKVADSVNIVLSKAKADTTKVRLYIGQARVYQHLQNIDAAFANAEKALQLAKKLNWDKGIIESYAAVADVHLINYDPKNARVYFNKALAVAKDKKDKISEGRIYRAMASSYSIEDYDKASAYFKKSFAIFANFKMYEAYCQALMQAGLLHERKGNYYEAADCYRKMMIAGEKVEDKGYVVQGNQYLAVMYARQGNDAKAREYLFRALKLQEGMKVKDQEYSSTLMQIGNSYLSEKNFDKALSYYTKGYNLAKASKNKTTECSFALVISDLYREKNDKQNAQLYIGKAVEASKFIKEDEIRTQIFQNIALIEFNNDNFDKALEYHQKSLQLAETLKFDYFVSTCNGNVGATMVTIAKEKTGAERESLLIRGIGHLNKALIVSDNMINIADVQLFSKYLSEAYEMQGNTAKALEAYKNHIVYKDSLENTTKRDEFNARQMDYEYGKKEALLKAEQAARVEREQTMRNISFGGAGVLLIVAAGSGFAYRRKRKDNDIIVKEKKRSDDLLLNILPQEVAEELKEKGEAAAHYYEHVSILFTDFEGFTQISSKMSPQEVIGELNYCFRAFDEIITKYNIEKIKTIGDAYMAVSGLPSSSPDHAINAVKAAIEIRDFIIDYKEQRKREGKVFFEMRIGINSGEVVAGIVGIKKFAYDIWGDAVNIAARMESNGVVGKINISESTYELVKDEFDAEYRGEIEAKGKGKVKMYFVEPKKSEIGI